MLHWIAMQLRAKAVGEADGGHDRRSAARRTGAGGAGRTRTPWARRGRLARVLAALIALGLPVIASAPAPALAQRPDARRAWLGVELERGPAGGVIAKHVIRTSPAAQAGISDGDQIVAADGTMLDEPKQLVARVALIGPGNEIKLKVRRGGAERDVATKLASFPGSDQILRLDRIGTFAPQWKALSPVSGNVPASVSSLRGKVVVLDFWASWCGPCRVMSPLLSKWQTAYGAQGLAIVGVTGDPVETATRAAQALDMRYAVASDKNDATAELYSVRALPTMYVIDKKGVIRDILVGYDPSRHKELEKLLQSLLAEPAPPAP